MAVPDLRGNPKKQCMAAGSLFSKCLTLTVVEGIDDLEVVVMKIVMGEGVMDFEEKG